MKRYDPNQLNFDDWMAHADMPARDSKGQWFDRETGLYFDPDAIPAINQRLPQYWGQRVTFSETRRGDVLIVIENSAHREVGRRVVVRGLFDQRPRDDRAAVAWACQQVGIGLMETSPTRPPEPSQGPPDLSDVPHEQENSAFDDQRAYALIMPEIPGECPESVMFGFAQRLADRLLMWKGWSPAQRTPDEINATLEALKDPTIDAWGCTLIEAQHRIVPEAAWVADLDALRPYYQGPVTDDEYAIREWIEHHTTDRRVKHALFDLLVEQDRDLDAPGLVDQIRQQMDAD